MAHLKGSTISMVCLIMCYTPDSTSVALVRLPSAYSTGGSEYCPFLLVRFMLLYTAPDVKRQLIEHRQHLAENSCAQRKLVILFYQIMSTDNAQINEKTLPQITVRLLFATSSRFAFYQYNHKSSALCVDFSVFSRQSCVPSTRTCCLTVFSKPLFSYVACTYQVYLQAGHNVQK